MEWYRVKTQNSTYTLKNKEGHWYMNRNGTWRLILRLEGENVVLADKIKDYRQFVGSRIRYQSSKDNPPGETTTVKEIQKIQPETDAAAA